MKALHNNIALRYKQSIVIGSTNGKTLATHIRGLLLDISQLGYTLSGEAVRAVRGLNEVEFKQFHTMLVANLKEMVGDNVTHHALFKNFPMDIPDNDEYFVQRFIGYVTNMFDMVEGDVTPLSCGHVIDNRLFNIEEFGACPICQRQVDELDDNNDRPPLEDITPFKIINVITPDDVRQLFTNLLSANSSISEEDRHVITMMIDHDPSLFEVVPEMHMKEIVAVIAGQVVQYTYGGKGEDYTAAARDVLINNVKTATDVLRLAVQLSGGDISLTEKSRFKLKNKERRVIMWLLNKIKHPEEDMLRYKMRWIRLAEVIHAGKFANKFPNAFNAIDIIRNDAENILTFNGEVEVRVNFINKGNATYEEELIDMLIKRPGEFARRMDWMLRTFTDNDLVVTTFEKLIGKLTTKMLLTLSSHFKNRVNGNTERCFMPKGNIAKMQIVDDERPAIITASANTITSTIETELLERFSNLDSLGDVYINEDLRNYLVPMVQRNASKSLVTVARGSQSSLTEMPAVRMFVYWKNNNSRVDVDLSALCYDENWNYKSHLGFTNLSDVEGYYSGDIQSAPNGASEFIDINIERARNSGYRYVIMNVNSFCGQPFDTFECFAGVMEREFVESGAKYEPTTVTNKFDVAGDTKYNVPLILDLETNTMIWADMSIKAEARDTAFGKSTTLGQIGKVIVEMRDAKPNLFDLVKLHATARATSVDTIRQHGKKYDTVFDVDLATNIDEIMAKWIA